MLSLVVTPLRTLTGWNRLIAMRRNLGVLGFFYLAAHFLIFFWFDRQASVSSTLARDRQAPVPVVRDRRAGADDSARAHVDRRHGQRLGAKRWKRLHRLAYVIAIGGVIHYYLLVKSDMRQPLAFAVVVGALLAYRLVAHYVDLRARGPCGADRGSAGRARPKKQSFWSGELVDRADLRRDARRQDVPAGRPPTAARCRSRTSPAST